MNAKNVSRDLLTERREGVLRIFADQKLVSGHQFADLSLKLTNFYRIVIFYLPQLSFEVIFGCSRRFIGQRHGGLCDLKTMLQNRYSFSQILILSDFAP